MITAETVIDWMKSLARSQGMYGRLLEAYYEATDEGRKCFIDGLNENGVKDMLDFVMFIEG